MSTLPEVEIVVPKGMTYPGFFYEDPDTPMTKAAFLSEDELAAGTNKFIIPCNDVVLFDHQGRWVLAKRLHAAAKGWWWNGGAQNRDMRPGQSIAKILQREIGRVPSEVTFIGMNFMRWTDCRERPGKQRTDLLLVHAARVSEAEIAAIELDPNEYDVSAGLMRYDGTQPVRDILSTMYGDFRRLRQEQPEAFA